MIKGITLEIRMLCFVLINNVILSLLCLHKVSSESQTFTCDLITCVSPRYDFHDWQLVVSHYGKWGLPGCYAQQVKRPKARGVLYWYRVIHNEIGHACHTIKREVGFLPFFHDPTFWSCDRPWPISLQMTQCQYRTQPHFVSQ